jgi:integrase
MRITKEQVDDAPAPASGYKIYWDDTIKGFGLQVTSAGVKSFVIQYRVNGKSRRMALGKYGKLTAEQARKEAKKKTGEIVQGIDPLVAKRRKEAQGITLEAALTAYCQDNNRLKESTKACMRGSMIWGCKEWMNKPVAAITGDMVLRRHKQLGERSRAQANVWGRYLRAIFNRVMKEHEEQGDSIIKVNPVQILSTKGAWYEIKRRQTVIPAHQIGAWWQAVDNLSNPVAQAYLRLLMLTGLRREEGLGLRWGDVDLITGALTVRDTKNHEDHTLPLGRYLHSMFSKMPRYGEFVFSNARGERLSNLRYALEKVRTESGVIFTRHDLRRGFASAGARLVTEYELKKLMNHKRKDDVTQGYVIFDTMALKEPMQRIEDFFLKAAGVVPGAEIVPMQRVAE